MKTLLVAVFAVAIVVSGARGAVYETVVPITTSDMLKEVPVAWTAVSESNGLRLRYEAKSIEPTRMFDAVDLYIFSYPLEGRDLSKAVHDLIQVDRRARSRKLFDAFVIAEEDIPKACLLVGYWSREKNNHIIIHAIPAALLVKQVSPNKRVQPTSLRAVADEKRWAKKMKASLITLVAFALVCCARAESRTNIPEVTGAVVAASTCRTSSEVGCEEHR
jgi:hypothetical protein